MTPVASNAKAAFALLIALLLVEVGIAAGLWLRIQQLKRLSAISAWPDVTPLSAQTGGNACAPRES